MVTKTTIEILDSNLNYITKVTSPVPLNGRGVILQYSKELSDFGTARFRISAYDPLWTAYGDIVKPHAYHVRLVRGTTTVWQGAIIQNGIRNKDFVEVTAVEYVWYLGKVLINRTSTDPNSSSSNTNIFRVFSSGTMAAAVTAIMNETITKYANSNHALATLSVGTIENPNYPPNMTDGNSPPKALTGPWAFGDGTSAPLLTFDFHSILYVLKSFGAYTFADFNIDSSLAFNFKKFLGNDHHYDVNFVYGKQGNVVDYNITRLGQRQVNSLWGIASDPNGLILNQNLTDQSSIQTYGLLEEVVGYTDIKDQATLNARVAAELPFISTPDGSADSMTVDETAYPLGLYDVGDIVSFKVKNAMVNTSGIRRIVGLTVNLHDTGRELTTLQFNVPQAGQYGAA